ncbi:MAG TPA: transglutaminase family protein [bacterium]|nr:transglutaminase family protein [bacterium]
MRLKIEHRSVLHFEAPVVEQHCELRLKPREDKYQRLLSHRLEIGPKVQVFEYADAYGNQVQSFGIIPPHQRLEIHFSAEVESYLENPFDFVPPAPAEEQGQLKGLLKQSPRLLDFVLSRSERTPELAAQGAASSRPAFDPAKNFLPQIQAAMAWIQASLKYLPESTEVHHPLAEVLGAGVGVCQDFSHLLIALLRGWGIPARYVMGYQYLAEARERAAATHAWTEAYMPSVGWRGFDASTGLLADATYLPVAVGRDSQDAAPHRGCYKGGAAGLPPEVHLQVASAQ